MLPRIRSWWRALTGQPRFEDEMADEMSSHMERYAGDLVARGVAPEEARRRARIEFGSTAGAMEECREAVGLRWPDEIARDFRYAVRVLRKSPAFTIAAVSTLALCIGANTAIFSVVDAVMFRPLPYPAPDRLAAVTRFWYEKNASGENTPQSGRVFEAVRDGATNLDVAAYSYGLNGVNVAADHRVEYVRQQRVSANFFHVLGVAPLIGREFSTTEDRAGGPPVTVLSYALWRRVFNGNPAIVGQAVMLRGEPYTIVGVMPRQFDSGQPADLWTPLRPSRHGEGEGTNYRVVARLHPGVTWAQADAQVEAIGAPILRERRTIDRVRLGLISLQRGHSEDVRRPLLVFWAAVGLVLIIGCVNIAGLLLARAAGRTREMATRMALGSGRSALLRQLLAESLLVGVCGGICGAFLGWLGLSGLKYLGQDSPILWNTVRLDFRVLAATAGVSIVAGLLFGVYPAIVATRQEIRAALGEAGRGVAGSRNPWPRRLLVTGEIALGIVLLVGAGLLIRTFAHLRGLNPGFDAHNVISAQLSLQDARYTTAERINLLFDRSLARMREIPGVESAAVALSLPYERALNTGFQLMERPHSDNDSTLTNYFYITPDYFRTLRIPLLRGRVFTPADTRTSAQVAVVSEAFVTNYMRGANPVGMHLDLGGGEHREIVGVVGDIQQKSGWGEDRGPVSAMPDVYVPAAQTDDKFMQVAHTWFAPSWIVRTNGSSEGLIAGMQRALESVDPQIPFAGFHSMDDVRYRALAEERFEAVLLGSLAGLALLLAAVGVYGLIANSVAERTRELGIRLALGASLSQAMRAVALPGIALALAGIAAGSILAVFASRVLQHLIWGVRAGDPLTFVAAGAGLLAVAAAASFIPALRVTRLNPADTLRHE